jgi:hypothetical protein
LPKKNNHTYRRHRVMLALGVSVCLLAALVMVAGESIFGENYSGIATIVGIVGISLTARSSKGRVTF